MAERSSVVQPEFAGGPPRGHPPVVEFLTPASSSASVPLGAMATTGVPSHRTVLVVDNDPAEAHALCETLRDAGFILHAMTFGGAVDVARALHPDVVVVSIGNRQAAGLDSYRELLSSEHLPVIVVGASGDEVAVVVALELGADDYLVRPYRDRELVARVDAVGRRAALGPPALARSRWRAGPIEVDLDLYQVLVRGEPVHLPVKEFKLLVRLISNTNRVVRRGDLVAAAWPDTRSVDRKLLDVHMKRLRHSIEANPDTPTQLLTIRGVGYKLLDAPLAPAGDVSGGPSVSC